MKEQDQGAGSGHRKKVEAEKEEAREEQEREGQKSRSFDEEGRISRNAHYNHQPLAVPTVHPYRLESNSNLFRCYKRVKDSWKVCPALSLRRTRLCTFRETVRLYGQLPLQSLSSLLMKTRAVVCMRRSCCPGARLFLSCRRVTKKAR